MIICLGESQYQSIFHIQVDRVYIYLFRKLWSSLSIILAGLVHLHGSTERWKEIYSQPETLYHN